MCVAHLRIYSSEGGEGVVTPAASVLLGSVLTPARVASSDLAIAFATRFEALGSVHPSSLEGDRCYKNGVRRLSKFTFIPFPPSTSFFLITCVFVLLLP